MTEFDPNHELDSQAQADAYIGWCADNFMRLSQGQTRTYRSAIRCAHWLLVVATAQLHLDEDLTENREALLDSLVQYQRLARALERQREHYTVERLIILRASLGDCWEPVGTWARQLLTAARCAISALILVELHPLVDHWEVQCPDVWALLTEGQAQLAMINDADELSFDDYAVRPDERVVAKFTWQRANNLTRRLGMPPMSPN